MSSFATSPLNVKNRRVERLWQLLFLLMTILLILPVVIILTVLVIKGGPVLSLEFLFNNKLLR